MKAPVTPENTLAIAARIKAAIRNCPTNADITQTAKHFVIEMAHLHRSGDLGKTMVIQIKNLAAYRRWEIRTDRNATAG